MNVNSVHINFPYDITLSSVDDEVTPPQSKLTNVHGVTNSDNSELRLRDSDTETLTVSSCDSVKSGRKR